MMRRRARQLTTIVLGLACWPAAPEVAAAPGPPVPAPRVLRPSLPTSAALNTSAQRPTATRGDAAPADASSEVLPEGHPLPSAAKLKRQGPVPLAMTISGGVSLGAYEAGFLYYNVQMLRQYPQVVDLMGAAGASAGSLNALLMLLAYCGQSPAPPPHESLFWQVWVPLGMRELYAPGETNNLGLFSRRWMRHVAERIGDSWEKGLPTSCDVTWGVAATRLYPRNVSLAQSRLDLPRIEEKFTLRIQGRGYGSLPRVRNYVDPTSGLEKTLMVEDEHGEVRFREMRDLTFASCSFPLAFSPMALRYCVTNPSAPEHAAQCTERSSGLGQFVDGGVLDNSPLRLMARTVAEGLAVDGAGNYRWRETPHDERQTFPDHARFMFVSPDAADYPIYDALGRESSPTSALHLLKQLAATFVSTARTKELYTLLEEHPELRDHILLPRRHYPTASGLMSAFFGFFERDLRVFDFYLGMYDARRAFDEDFRPVLMERSAEALPEPVYPEEEGMGTPETAQQWLPLLCLRGIYDQQTPLISACAGEPMHNFRVLAQTSLVRLYDNCARLDPKALTKTRNLACLAGARGELPPKVPGATGVRWRAWRREVGESELMYLLRLLAEQRFAFHDLGLKRDQSDQALFVIRQRLVEAGNALAAKQPLGERSLLQLGTEYAVDYSAYAPPARRLYFTLGRSVELGANQPLFFRAGHPASLRFEALAWVDGTFSFLTSQRSLVAFGPGLGLEVLPRRRGSAHLTTWRLGVRGGFMFAQGDRLLSRTCPKEVHRSFGGCSRPRLELVTGVTAFEHLRLQLAFSWYPPARPHEPHLWAVGPGLGLQF